MLIFYRETQALGTIVQIAAGSQQGCVEGRIALQPRT